MLARADCPPKTWPSFIRLFFLFFILREISIWGILTSIFGTAKVYNNLRARLCWHYAKWVGGGVGGGSMGRRCREGVEWKVQDLEWMSGENIHTICLSQLACAVLARRGHTSSEGGLNRKKWTLPKWWHFHAAGNAFPMFHGINPLCCQGGKLYPFTLSVFLLLSLLRAIYECDSKVFHCLRK